MKKLCKLISVIALTIALAACANEPSSVPEPPLISDSGGNSVSSPTTNGSSESTTSNISSVKVESSTDIKTESTAGGTFEDTSNNSSTPESSKYSSDTGHEITTSSVSGNNSEVTSTSSVSSSSITEKPLKPEPIIKENPGMFDLDSKTVTLNSGYVMPINGLGTYSLTGDTCVRSVKAALQSGVRLIDTAYMYSNEEEVGRAIRESGVPREEIFVITKLYPNQFSDPETAIEQALKKLDIGYIDMMLLHHPGTNDVKAYKAMEKYVQSGKIRSLGLSNWYVKELGEFLPQVTIKPALVQNEIHPYYQENDVIPYIQSLGITVQGWYPLGGRGHTKELLGDKIISEIAAAHGKSSAQVILRWNLQKGVVVIPGSSNPDHIKENTELYDFELSEDEMNQINALDRNEKHDWY